MKILPITKLVMDDICKNENDIYQVAFYKIENFEIEKKISLNIEQTNCNKVRIVDLDWLKEQELLNLPDVLIIKETTNLTIEEQILLVALNIKLCFIDENIMKDEILFRKKIDEIEKKIYESKTQKYFEIEKEKIGNIEEECINNNSIKNKTEITNTIITETLDVIKKKDIITYNHVKNVSDYVDIFVKGMPEEEKLSEAEISFLKRACLVHDIGKLAIPNQILKKKGTLNENEYHDMKKHVSQNAYLFNSKIMNEYRKIVLCHHERYDGLGYPNGLKQEQIPYFARIISVLDAFEAMTGKREYIKEEDRKSLYEVLNILIENSGTQFDPKIVKYFIMGVIKDKTFQMNLKIKVKRKIS